MKRIALVVTLIVACWAVPVLAQQNCSPTEEKVAQWIRSTGYKYRAASCAVWLVEGAVGSLPAENMLVGVEGDALVMGFVAVKKADLDLSAATLQKLLEENNNIDYAKIGIDNDGDLFVRQELHVPQLDEGSFKQAIHDVSTAMEKVHSVLQ